MKSVAQILKTKADSAVYSIAPTASVYDAARLMAQRNIGALMVLDGAAVIGIVTERDFARKTVLLADRTPRDTPVREIMDSPVVCVSPAMTNEECMALMTDKRVRHLPVLDQGRLVGLVSIGDLVKDIIAEQSFVIQQLEHYISGDRGP